MSPWSIFRILAGVIGTLLAGVGWKQLRDRQAQHMHDYGDKERNKHGLWKRAVEVRLLKRRRIGYGPSMRISSR